MNKISYLLSGILIGLFISHILNRPSSKSIAIGIDSAEVEMTSQPKKMIVSKTISTVTSQSSTDQKKETNLKVDSASSHVGANLTEEAKPKQQLELIITEEIVKELEKDWYDLPKQARLNHEANGWRVGFVAENSVFSKTGLQAGDFISRQAIDNLKFDNSNDPNLTQRVIRILTHIQ